MKEGQEREKGSGRGEQGAEGKEKGERGKKKRIFGVETALVLVVLLEFQDELQRDHLGKVWALVPTLHHCSLSVSG